jgi:hypothetical protein
MQKNSFFSRIIGWILPEYKKGQVQFDHRSVLVSYLLLTLGIVLSFVLLNLFAKNLLGVSVNMIGVAFLCLAIYAIKKGTNRNSLFSAYLYLSILLILLSVHQLFTAKFVLHNIIWIPLMTGLSVTLLGRRKGFFWTVLIVLAFGIVNLITFLDINLPQYQFLKEDYLYHDILAIVLAAFRTRYELWFD